MVALAVEDVLFTTGRASRQRPIADAPFHRWVLPDGSDWGRFYRRGGSYLLRFPKLADFEVSCDGREVLGVPAPRLRPSTLEHLFLNQVRPLALSRQGRFVLHASAVDIGGAAIAFAGASGFGKSTLAAAFAAAGNPFLTDDGLELQWRAGVPYAVPNHPSIRLHADSEAALGIRGESAPPLEYTGKQRFMAGPRLPHAPKPMPLKALMFVRKPTNLGVDMGRVDSAEALVEIVRHSFLLDMTEQELLSQHFDEIARLARLPIHHLLRYPRRFADLPRVLAAIEEHAGGATIATL